MPEKLIVNNLERDNANLPRIRDRKIIIGLVDDKTGAGAVEVPGLVLDQDEMLALVKYWTQDALEVQFFEFTYATTGGTERRRRHHAWHRIGCIADLLGDEVVNKAVNEAATEFGKTRDPRLWQIFMHGDNEAWKAVQDEVQRDLDRQVAERNNNP